jgi:hypothetical protein
MASKWSAGRKFGLRLAIRNGYMNFYRCGQSIGRISLNRGGQPILSVHAKYVLPKADRDSLEDQEYLTLTTTSLARRNGRPALPYDGIETMKGWVRVVDECYRGDEKSFVDELLSVPANDGVIDLEMGLPAWREKSSATRMDLVSVERVDGRLVIYFGEVKLVTDSRLRCREPLKQNQKPEVLRQLSDYRKYLAEPGHATSIGEQYSNAARLMRQIRMMADAIGTVRPLGQAILDAADEELAVSDLARLIVANKNNTKAYQDVWAKHQAKLEAEKERVPMIVLNTPAPLNFGEKYR